MRDAQSTEPSTTTNRYLTFHLGEQAFGLDIASITEIVGIQTIVKIPESAEYIKGIINLRGRIIPVVDARVKMHMSPAPYGERTCIIIVGVDGSSAGLIVDSVAEVATIDATDIVPPPQGCTGASNPYIHSIGKFGGEILLLLDCARILDDKALEHLRKYDTEVAQ